MATTIEQQVAMYEALVPRTQRLRIGRSNFRLPSDIQSKESTLQLVYDVLRRCSFFKAFLVMADVPEIYIQAFWATAYVHQHSIRFKMNNKKHIVNLESFRDMLHISPRIPGQSFDELPLEEEILEFIRFLGHSATTRTLTDININKLYQPWRSFAAIINKCLTGKSSGYDSFRLSQAQILLGLYYTRNIDYAFLIWEDFVYQVVYKNHKKSNEMDDCLFSTIKVVSRHQNTQQYGEMLPIELTNDEIRNTNAYKEYHAFAHGKAVPKPKASARKKKSDSDTSITPPTATLTPRPTTAATPRLTVVAKGKQPAKATKAKSLSALSEVAMTEAEQLKLVLKRSRQQMHISQSGGLGTDEGAGSKPGVLNEIAKIDEQDDTEKGGDDDEESKSDEEDDDEETRDEESFDPIPKTPESSADEGNDEEDQGLKSGEEERLIKEEEADELYRDIDINQGRGIQLSQDIEDSYVTLTPVNPDGQQESSSMSSQFVTSMLNPTSDACVESIFVTASSSAAPLPTPTPTMTPSIIATITTASQAPIPPTSIPSEVPQNLPTFASVFRFEDRLKSLEANFSEFRQTNLFAEAVYAILVEVLTRSSHSSRTSYAVAADLSEMELKKILIEKMEGYKSIQRSDEQRKLYKGLVEAYEADKIILETYGETVTLKRRRDDEADKDEGPSTGSDRGSKRWRECKEPESASAPLETTTRSAGRSTTGSKSRQASASESAFVEEPVQTTSQIEEPSHPVFETGAEDQPIHPEWFSQPQKPPTPDRDWNKTLPAVQGSTQTWISELAKQADTRSSFNELLDTALDFSNFIMNRLRVDTLTPELLAGPTYELMKGSCKSLIELEYHLEEVYKATTDQLDWVNPEDYRNIKWIEDLVPRTMWIQEPIDYDKHALWGVSHWGRKHLKIVEWHSYKHLDWISVRRDDDKIYKFKEGDFKRLRHQDIKDMLLLLVQGKLSNLTVEERFAFNVSLRMFTRSIVIQRRVEDLQLRVKSYQKRLNLTKPDTYRSDLKRREAYAAFSNPRGFIYQNKDKKIRLMRIDELHKFNDRTLNDVRTALDDRLKGIRMQYLPQTIWRKGDKDRAAAMIQAIDKMLKTRKIMMSLEKFVGGRLYEGDFRTLQRTI
uniref:Monodehydroascorbate reductase n=1 Tax=Tanacetum cinerariifolium TaxID=118510 RepID=A0A699GK17_TANCI|nr:hypothetical protein [Tanacetum cinerariifolium]